MDPPESITLSLDEALELPADLEDVRDALITTRQLVLVMDVERQVRLLARRLDIEDPDGGQMAEDLLRATRAARRLGIPTVDLVRLIHGRQIRYVMVEGIAHIPEAALDEYRHAES